MSRSWSPTCLPAFRLRCRLTQWKLEGALKVIATLRRQGFITTKQIAECGVSATNWTRSWFDKGAERGTWVESPRMPSFDQQHP